jgi:putative two-component system response regulator
MICEARGPLALIADDEETCHTLMERVLRPQGFRVAHAYNGEQTLEFASKHHPDLILLDVIMSPTLTGFDVCRRLKANPKTRFIPVVIVSGIGVDDARVEGLRAGADDYFVKPFSPPEVVARLGALVNFKRFLEEFEASEQVMGALAAAMDARDSSTRGHSVRVSHVSTRIGQAMRLPEPVLRQLRLGAIVHDLGKIGVPDLILQNPGKLTLEEMEEMRSHPEIGERILAPLKSMEGLLPIVRSHHERLDGSGYPDGLTEEKIPLLVRIVSVADVYDALTTARPYRAPMSPAEAMLELERDAAAGKLDRNVVSILGRLTRETDSARYGANQGQTALPDRSPA